MAVGDVGDMRLAVKRQHMMLAERIKFDVLHQHHLLVLFAERRRADDLQRVFVISFRQERHCLGHPFGGLLQPFACGILAQ